MNPFIANNMRIKKEKAMADSLLSPICEKRKTRTTSLVPMPAIDTGIILARDEIEVKIIRFKIDIFITKDKTRRWSCAK